MKQQRSGGLWRFLRVSFLAGLFVALPLGISVGALIWLWGKLDAPLRAIFGYADVPGAPWERLAQVFGGSPHYEDIVVPLLGLCLLIVALVVLGILVRSIVGRYLLARLEKVVARVPLAGMLYTSIKQFLQAFVDTSGPGRFHSAVLVQFPMQGSWVIGFVTGAAYAPLAEAMLQPLREDASGQKLPPPEVVTVFVPTTPLPTQGFTLVLPRSETRELGMPVQEAIKLVISGGIAASDK